MQKHVLLMKYLIVLIYCFCTTGLVQAQSYYFKNYQVNDGVSSNSITSITQDKKGFMWFGTRNGLNRFDGHTFRVFQNNVADSTSIGSNSILSLFEDRNEQLWVGTYKGVYIFNPLTESFAAFKKLPEGEVRFIKHDDYGNIWLVIDFALYKYDTKKAVVALYKFANAQTTAICFSPNGSLWAATNHGMLKKFDAVEDAFIDYDLRKTIGAGLPNQLLAIYPSADTAVLVGTMNNVLLFDTRKLGARTIFKKQLGKHGIQVHQIMQQSENEFWVGTETGLCVVNLQSGEAQLVQKQFDNPYALTDNVVTVFWKDREGGTWIGTRSGGINYFSKSYNAFQKYFPKTGGKNLSGNLVHEVCGDKYGAVWIGTEDAGLNKLDPETGRIQQFLAGNKRGSISYLNLHGIVADGDELWVGTYEHGLDVLNIKTGTVVRHYNASGDATSLKSNFILTIFKTKSGDILIGTWNGMVKYNRRQDNFIQMPVFSMPIQSIHEDDDGSLWVGSYGNGVYYYNPATGSSGNLRHEVGNNNTISSNYVTGIFNDSHKNLWICSEDGLSKLDAARKKVTPVVIETGVQNTQFFRIQEDNKKKLWISTAKGLIHYDPASGKTKVYATADGLTSDQFNYNSSFKSPDGVLYFGTVKGLISFRPEFEKNTFVPPVYITRLHINNKQAVIGTENAPLNKSILYTSQLTLPYDRSNLSFEVAALSYTTPEKNEYVYKMEGLEKEWTHLKTARAIYYTKLPPGNYTFKVKGASGGEVWNEKERELHITILPPIWASTAAYLLYAIILLCIIIIIFRYYSMALTEKNMRKIKTLEIEKEREIYNAKIEFFTNITHEIRTPLTLIKLPLEKLMHTLRDNTDINESLKMMKRNTNRLIDLTNQLLDFRKAEADNFSLSFLRTDVNELLKETAAPFKKAAEEKGLTFKLEMPRLSLHAYIDAEAFRKIMNNLFSNAIKYANSSIFIGLLPFGSTDQAFKIEVKSDGFLIPYELGEKIFEAFYRMKETEKQAGTGIGLPLARSLAVLHKGTLLLKEPQNGFNIFLLSLPIHQEKEIHFDDDVIIETAIPAVKHAEVIADTGKPFILLVEDSKEILGFIESELRPAYNILKAYNGQEALEALQTENVQLVVSDIMMPVMDGIALCKKLKTDFQYSHIPIILLTAKNTLNSKIEGLEVGADAYIEKPFAFEHLQAQITNLIVNRNIIKDYFARSPLTHLKGIACSRADANFLEQLHDVIYENITDIDLDVDQLSKLMNISRPTLYRKIKALSNLTPNELINLSRLKKAAELLRLGDYKINEVANMVGYSLQSNFSRDFHKQFGITPSSYMSSVQSEKKPG